MDTTEHAGDGRAAGPDAATRAYTRDLTAHLYREGVRGARIGEILAEVEAHVAASGETARDAFGPPAEYARRWAAPQPAVPRRRRVLTIAAVTIGSTGAGALLAAAALRTGRGADLLGLPAWLVLAAAVVALATGIALVPVDRIVDPRTGEPRSAGRRELLLGAGTVLVLVTVALVAVGAWTG